MKKKINYYNVFMTTMIVIIAGLLLATGIIAVQKAMNMKVGVSITPSHEIRIDYGGETIFCNTTKDSAGIKVASGYTLSGNTLTFTQDFIAIGETFALTIYNYNTSYLQVSVNGTGASANTLIIAPYSTTALSGVLNLTIGAGASEAVLSFENVYAVSHSGSNYTFSGNATVLEGNSYSASFSAPQFYNLPDTLTITMGGVTLTSGYTYTKTSDTVATLTINEVTGDVKVVCDSIGDTISVIINVYLDASLNSTTVAKISYPNASTVLTIGKKFTILGSEKWITFSESVVFEPSSGSGTGYNWSAKKTSISSGGAYKLKVTINITWGTVESAITIDIYGTTSS